MEPKVWEFRDGEISFPARVFYLMKDGRISLTDFLIMHIIKCSVRPQTDKPGMGCFQGNGFIGRSVNVHPVYASKRIQHLNELGLILIVIYEGKRYLELEWSRTAEERASLEGGYGKANRKAHKELIDRIGNNCTDKGKHLPQPKGKHLGGVNVNIEHKKNCISTKDNKKINSPSPHPADDKINGKSFGFIADSPDDQFIGEIVDKYWNAVSAKNMMDSKSTKKGWRMTLRQLLKIQNNKSEIAEHVDKYLDILRPGMGKSDYIPEAWSIPVFCKKYPQIVSHLKSQENQNYRQAMIDLETY